METVINLETDKDTVIHTQVTVKVTDMVTDTVTVTNMLMVKARHGSGTIRVTKNGVSSTLDLFCYYQEILIKIKREP